MFSLQFISALQRSIAASITTHLEILIKYENEHFGRIRTTKIQAHSCQTHPKLITEIPYSHFPLKSKGRYITLKTSC